MRGIDFRGAVVAALTMSVLAGCAVLESGEHDGAQSELNRQRRQWRAQEIESYEYTVQRSCFCTEEFRAAVVVRVEDGAVAGRTYRESGAAVTADGQFWPAVDGLFDLVQDAIDRDADSLVVEYHPELGYPVSIQVDYEEMMADEELYVTASGLDR